MGLLKFIDIDGRRFAWHDLLQRRRRSGRKPGQRIEAKHRGDVRRLALKF